MRYVGTAERPQRFSGSGAAHRSSAGPFSETPLLDRIETLRGSASGPVHCRRASYAASVDRGATSSGRGVSRSALVHPRSSPGCMAVGQVYVASCGMTDHDPSSVCPYCRKPVDPDAASVIYAVPIGIPRGTRPESRPLEGVPEFFHPGCPPEHLGYERRPHPRGG
jgi:hypothetical protein